MTTQQKSTHLGAFFIAYPTDMFADMYSMGSRLL